MARRPAIRLNAEALAGVLLFAIATVAVFGTRWGQLVVDTRPDLYLAPWRLAARSLQAWTIGPSLGAPNYDAGYLPAAVIVGVFRELGLSAWAAMRAWRLALYAVAGVGAWLLYRDLRAPEAPGQGGGRVGRLAAGVAYVANPYVLVGAATTPIMLPYALLPWLLWFLRRSFRPGRRWVAAAAFALVFLVMSGINAGIVALFLLLAVAPIVIDARLREHRPWRVLLTSTTLCLTGALLASAYWLAASLTAVGVGQGVADSSESPTAIASVSSFAEVLRGLGMWPLYGADKLGPFRPGYVVYVTNGIVVVASFLIPVLAFLGAWRSRSRIRLLAVLLVATGAVVMVGLNPPAAPSLFGRVLQWTYTNVPGAIAFRTTSKAGAILLLGLALLIGLLAEWLRPQLRRSVVGPALGWLLIIALAASLAPVVRGALWAGPLPIPGYWYDAAAHLDARASGGRVWLIPGQSQVSYRWGRRSVDDLGLALMARPSLVRTTVPNVSAPAANMLSAADQPLQAGTMPPGSLSVYARYLGVSDLLVRNDLVWEDTGQVRPAVLAAQLAGDPGLTPTAHFGAPGQFVTSPSTSQGTDGAVEQSLPPLQVYRVTPPGQIVRTYSAAGTTLVAGDNAALGDLAYFRLLDGTQQFRLLGSMTPTQVSGQLDQGARLVLTDTNRRRAANDRRLDATGPLLDRSARLGSSRALFDPSDQTVQAWRGVADVTASTNGSVFGPVAYGHPALAVDGDPGTAWQFGDFGSATGQWLRIDFGRMRPVQHVTVVPQNSAPNHLDTVSVTVDTNSGPVVRTVSVATGPATATFPAGTRGSVVTVTAVTTTGGANQVGIAEVRIPGMHAVREVQLPADLKARLGTDPAKALESTSVDVLLARAQWGEHERSLQRTVDLPVPRRYTWLARVTAVLPSASLADHLAGVDPAVHTASSSTLGSHAPGGGISHRSSLAFDGDPTTAWVASAGSARRSAWVQASFPGRRASSVDVDVDPSTVTGLDPVRLQVTVNGRPRPPTLLVDGQASAHFATTRVRRVQVRVLPGLRQEPIAINDVRIGDAAAPARPDAVPRPCEPLTDVDGRVLTGRVVGSVDSVADPWGAPAVACGRAVRLHGSVEVTAVRSPIEPQALLLSDRSSTRPTVSPAPWRGPTITTWSRTATAVHVDVGAASDAFDLVLADAYDARWHAVVDGRDLGAPYQADGFAMGWHMPAGRPRSVELIYRPQRVIVAGFAVSALTLVGCACVVAVDLLRRRRRASGAAELDAERTP